MSEEIKPIPPPSPASGTAAKILWLAVAFLPALVGICVLTKHSDDQGLLVILFVLNITGSLSASIGLGNGMNTPTRLLLVFLLSPVFFVLNFGIVFFVGCAQQGFGV